MVEIEKKAPLKGKAEIIIDASVDKVWKILTEIDNWHEWQEDVSSSSLNGRLEKGARFNWKAMGVNIRSEIILYEPHKVIGWKGDSIGMHAVHLWSFADEGSKTVVYTEESLSGWLAKLISIFSSKYLEGSLKKSLRSLKQAVEN